jgi:hypothetical protein
MVSDDCVVSPASSVGSVGVASGSPCSSGNATKRRHHRAHGIVGGNVPGVAGGKRHKGNNGNNAINAVPAVIPQAEAEAAQKEDHAVENDSPESPVGSPCAGGSGQGGGGGGQVDQGGYNSEDEYSHLGLTLTEEEWQEKDLRFERAMRKKGFIIKYMDEDGSCLFRAVADQVYGDQDMHSTTRRHCMDYIVSLKTLF